MSIALYELSTGYQNLLSLIDDEMPDQDILHALTTLEGQIEGKAISIANIIKQIEAEADVIKNEEKRLALRRRSRENAVGSMKSYLQGVMTQLDIDSLKSPTRSIKIQNNPPSVYVFDEDKIPGKFLTLVPEHYEVNKKLVADALKAKEVVPGAELTVGRSLRIR